MRRQGVGGSRRRAQGVGGGRAGGGADRAGGGDGEDEGVGEQNISARTDFTTDTSGRSISGSTDNSNSKRDWWFPNKAAFGRKKVYQAQDLFNRLTRQSTNLRGFDSFLIRDSTDVQKIDNQQNEWTDR